MITLQYEQSEAEKYEQFLSTKQSTGPMQMLSEILWACPEQANVKNNDGDFLLHIAAKNQAPLKIIEALLAANPEAAAVCNEAGELPLHCLLKSFLCFGIEDRVRVVASCVKEKFIVWPEKGEAIVCAKGEVLTGVVRGHNNGVFTVRLDLLYTEYDDFEDKTSEFHHVVKLPACDIARINDTDLFLRQHQQYFLQKARVLMSCFLPALTVLDNKGASLLQSAIATNVPVKLVTLLKRRHDHSAFVEFLICNKRFYMKDKDVISVIRDHLLRVETAVVM
jgi:hypothetical protein